MKILVIRFKHIGDVLLTSVLCNSLKQSFPDAEVDYMMHELCAPLFDQHPYISRVIRVTPQHRKNPVAYARLAFSLVRNRYDIIIDASSTEKSAFISLFSRRAKFRIGRKKESKQFGFTHLIEPSDCDKVAERLSMLQPLKSSGCEIVEDKQMHIELLDEEVRHARRMLRDAGLDFSLPIVFCNISGKEAYKKWPLKQMQTVLESCLRDWNLQLIFNPGLPHERLDGLELQKRLNANSRIFCNLPSNSLRGTAAILHHCQLYFGNEGGPRHIAHALGLPTLSVFSPMTEKKEWLPQASARHKGISWRDFDEERSKNVQRVTNEYPNYEELYALITAERVMPELNSMIERFVVN